MSDAPRRVTRRDFLQGSLAYPALAALFTATITVSCDDSSSDGGSDDPTCGAADCTISANHGHTVEITQAQLDAGSMVTLTLTDASTNGHTHTLVLSDAQVQSIADGSQVTETSSLNGHTHEVTFN